MSIATDSVFVAIPLNDFLFDRFTESNYSAINRLYGKDRAALTFLSNYENTDIAAVVLGPNSISLWIISPPDLERLKDDLSKNDTLKVRYKLSISRVTYSEKMPGTIDIERSFDLVHDSPARKELLTMLNNVNNTASGGKRIQLPFLFPKFLKVRR